MIRFRDRRRYDQTHLTTPVSISSGIRYIWIVLLFFLSFSISSAQIPTTGLVAYWPFNGNANDESGNGHHGVVNGATLVFDRFGNSQSAYAIGGGGDWTDLKNYIVVGSHPHFDIPTGTGFSISGWLRSYCVDSILDDFEWTVFSKGLVNYDPADDWYGLGAYRFDLKWERARESGVVSLGPINPDAVYRWHHIAVVISDTIKVPAVDSRRWIGLYIDNELVGFNQSADVAEVINEQVVYLGLVAGRGGIDDVRVYHHSLTPTEIGVLYSEGGWPESEAVTDTLIPVPNVTVDSLTPLTICAGESVRFKVSGDADTLVWNTTEGFEESEPGIITVTPSQSTLYTVFGINRDSLGYCQRAGNTNSFRVTVLERPAGDAMLVQTHCPTDVVTLARPTTGGRLPYRWEWTPADGLDDPAGRTPRLLVPRSDRFQVIVTDANGCRDTGFVRVEIDSVPAVDFGGDTLYFCKGTEGVEIRAEVADNSSLYSYRWSPAEGLSRTDSARVIAAPATTTSYVVRVENERGCFRLDTVVVVPTNERVVANAGVDTLVCIGTEIVIGVDPAIDGLHYSWSPTEGLNDPTIARPIARPDATTLYTLTVRDPKTGCFATDEITVHVRGLSIRSEPSSVDFGRTTECEAESIDTLIVIRNDGASDGVLGREVIVGPFSLLGPSLPAAIPAGSTLDVHVRYSPAAGTFNEELRFPFTAELCTDTVRVSLSAQVEEVALEADVSTLDFGTLHSCTVERDTTLELRNSSSREIVVHGVSLPNDYRLLDRLPLAIPAGGSAVTRIRYVPSGIGADNGQMEFAYEPCSGLLSLDLYGEQRDVFFNVVDTLDFGPMMYCDGTEWLLPLEILYEGSGVGRIASVEAIGPFTTTVTSGTVLNDGVAESFSVRFTPTGPGAFEGRLRLAFEPCGLIREVVLKGVAVEATLTATDFDFGAVGIGSIRNGTIVFRNTGEGVINVAGVGGVDPPFTIVSTMPTLPANIAPGGELRVEISYTAISGISIDSVRVETGMPCVLTFSGGVRGEGRGRAFSKILLPALSAVAGERITMRPILAESIDLDLIGARRYRTEVSFDRSLLVVGDDHIWRDDDVTGRRIVTLTGERGEGDMLEEIELIATLGRAESTVLQMESFVWEDASGPVEIDTEHGMFTLEGLCRDGGVRLYDPRGEVGIKSISPNPGWERVTIEYSLAEGGSTQLKIADALGRIVMPLFDGAMVAGEYRIEVEIEQLESGSYWALLQTPTVVTYRQLLIVR